MRHFAAVNDLTGQCQEIVHNPNYIIGEKKLPPYQRLLVMMILGCILWGAIAALVYLIVA